MTDQVITLREAQKMAADFRAEIDAGDLAAAAAIFSRLLEKSLDACESGHDMAYTRTRDIIRDCVGYLDDHLAAGKISPLNQPKRFSYLTLADIQRRMERAFIMNWFVEYDELAREVNHRVGFAKETSFIGKPLKQEKEDGQKNQHADA